MFTRLFSCRGLLKTSIAVLGVAVLAVFAISGYVGWNLTHPVKKPIKTTPGAVGLQYENVSFSSRTDGLQLKGWLIAAPENRLTVICAHGYRQNRVQEDVPLLPIAQALAGRGINVLLFDFRNCGESAGGITSVGQYEVRDLLGAVDFVRSQPNLSPKIALLGFSMGASVALMAAEQEPAVAAVIADSPFADLSDYLKANFSVWTDLPAVPFNQSILIMLPMLTGLHPETVSPIKDIAKLDGRPLLLIHGEADADIAIDNSELLQQAYPAARLVRIPGARHVKGFATDSNRYLTEVLAFLSLL